MEKFSSPQKMVHAAWHLLFKAAATRKGPYQTPVAATLGAHTAEQRVVVLREVSIAQRRLTFFTDARSAKVEALQEQGALSWLFWDSRKKMQMRMSGAVALNLQNEHARAYWEKLPVQGRSSYAGLQPPGTPLLHQGSTLPEYWTAGMSLEMTEPAFANFMVVQCQIEKGDLLHLHPEGHQRAVFSYEGEELRAIWAAP